MNSAHPASLRVLLVDDEPLARTRLRDLLLAERLVEVVGEAGDAAAAIATLADFRPNLLLLDVTMPRGDAFHLLRRIPVATRPLIIFATAHADFAVDAFDQNAIDYLLKPVNGARLREALARARDRLAPHGPTETTATDSTAAAIHRIHVRSGRTSHYVRVTDVDWFEAAGNYVILHAGKDSLIARQTMQSLQRDLPEREFHRLNRSIIVNLARVSRIESLASGDPCLVLYCGARIPFTRGVRALSQRLRQAPG